MDVEWRKHTIEASLSKYWHRSRSCGDGARQQLIHARSATAPPPGASTSQGHRLNAPSIRCLSRVPERVLVLQLPAGALAGPAPRPELMLRLVIADHPSQPEHTA